MATTASAQAGHLRSAGTDRYAHVTAMQRSRLLAAATGAVVEFGWDGATVGSISQRAGVSRRTFYELFENREECLLALLQSAIARITAQIAAADLSGLSWRERMRGGLWAILCFFDSQPALTRICLVESRRSDGIVLDYRRRIVERLVEIVDRGREEAPQSARVSALTAQGVVGGIFEVLYTQLSNGVDEPLRDLTGDLTGMIVMPYLGVAAAHREQSRPAPTFQPNEQPDRETALAGSSGRDLLAELPMRLTYRTATVLQALEEHPGQSNRQVADLVGIADQGQISKLLSRLARVGLLVNSGAAREPNRWALTPAGSRLTRSIRSYAELETGQVIEGEAHAF
ncbi:MAG TPA: TetR/AcrR family transcriptional regulator [Solirubrobacteraceae bacterium]|nr:TetR/AcrR family transcriptional regulator [Solirubrobacteraceae bacterium]